MEVYSDQPGVQLYTGGYLPPYSMCENTDSVCDCDKNSQDCSSGDCKCSSCDCESETMKSQVSRMEYLSGKNGAQYTQFGAFSIQPQNYPNAVNVVSIFCDFL
jgi:galactose mutarotase-like enzyme